MLRQCLVTRRRRRLDRQARSQGNKEPKQLATKPPYTSDGGRTYSLARKSVIVTFNVRNVQPLLNHPNTQSHVQGTTLHSNHYRLQQVLQLRAIPKSLECNTTSTPPFYKVLSSKPFLQSSGVDFGRLIFFKIFFKDCCICKACRWFPGCLLDRVSCPHGQILVVA